MTISLRRKRKIAQHYHQYIFSHNGQYYCCHDLPCGAFTGDLYFTGTRKECIELAYKSRFFMFTNHEITITFYDADGNEIVTK